jgi:hypothetical protein
MSQAGDRLGNREGGCMCPSPLLLRVLPGQGVNIKAIVSPDKTA